MSRRLRLEPKHFPAWMIYSRGLRKMRGIHELTLAERRVPYGRDHERHLSFGGPAFHFGWNALKGARDLGNAQPMRGRCAG